MKAVTGIALALTLAIASSFALAQANGKLQIHYMNVGQGDAAVLISPGGQVVLFDTGPPGQCAKAVAYLEDLGITEVHYHVASHYHQDHIGCMDEVLGSGQVTLKTGAFDRGNSYDTGDYDNYISTIGNKRKTANAGGMITLDAGNPSPVTIRFIAVNGDGINTTNENDLSVVALVEFEGFRAEFGGDLSGEKYGDYDDIETSVADKVGRVDVYKVHHHCSRYSTNAHWLDVTKPTIGIISVGAPNKHGHPTEDCLERLHAANVRTYWTTEGKGVDPDPQWDVVVGNVVVEVASGASTYTVSYHGHAADVYPIAANGGTVQPVVPAHRFLWSKNSSVYHYAQCPVAKRIKVENLAAADIAPTGHTLHQGCQENPN